MFQKFGKPFWSILKDTASIKSSFYRFCGCFKLAGVIVMKKIRPIKLNQSLFSGVLKTIPNELKKLVKKVN